MKILIVAAFNKQCFSPFIVEQVDSLKNDSCEIDYFGIIGKGIVGYLKNMKKLLLKIREFNPDIIHAHYGLSGLLANLQRRVPVVTTYHGSDINNDRIFLFSKLCVKFSAYNIFVTKKNFDKCKPKTNSTVIPCGVNTKLFFPLFKHEARLKLGFGFHEKLILFAGAFDNRIKNASLAIETSKRLQNVRLLELKDYSRREVVFLMNAVDVCLMTSFSEGSPQFIKEAMACNCPIVSVDVGDVKDVVGNTEGCFICSYDAVDITEKLQNAMGFEKRTNGRERIIDLKLESETTAKKLLDIYLLTLKK